VIERRLVEIALRALELGNNVVIDYGLWGRDERSALRQAAADRGASVTMHYFEVPQAEQPRRLDQRQTDQPHTTWPISDEELATWADIMQVPAPGELDGSQPIDDPRLDSPHGMYGAGTAGRHRSPDPARSSAMTARRHERSLVEECRMPWHGHA
jgi:hypothetical protein